SGGSRAELLDDILGSASSGEERWGRDGTGQLVVWGPAGTRGRRRGRVRSRRRGGRLGLRGGQPRLPPGLEGLEHLGPHDDDGPGPRPRGKGRPLVPAADEEEAAAGPAAAAVEGAAVGRDRVEEALPPPPALPGAGPVAPDLPPRLQLVHRRHSLRPTRRADHVRRPRRRHPEAAAGLQLQAPPGQHREQLRQVGRGAATVPALRTVHAPDVQDRPARAAGEAAADPRADRVAHGQQAAAPAERRALRAHREPGQLPPPRVRLRHGPPDGAGHTLPQLGDGHDTDHRVRDGHVRQAGEGPVRGPQHHRDKESDAAAGIHRGALRVGQEAVLLQLEQLHQRQGHVDEEDAHARLGPAASLPPSQPGVRQEDDDNGRAGGHVHAPLLHPVDPQAGRHARAADHTDQRRAVPRRGAEPARRPGHRAASHDPEQQGEPGGVRRQPRRGRGRLHRQPGERHERPDREGEALAGHRLQVHVPLPEEGEEEVDDGLHRRVLLEPLGAGGVGLKARAAGGG
ncbi:hypothetical protein THAOC_06367, partial [Thalassiosira oceanica]